MKKRYIKVMEAPWKCIVCEGTILISSNYNYNARNRKDTCSKTCRDAKKRMGMIQFTSNFRAVREKTFFKKHSPEVPLKKKSNGIK